MILCPPCASSEQQTKSGHTRTGSQRYKCKECQRIYTPPEPKPLGYPEETRRGVGTIGRATPYLEDTEAIPDNHVTIIRTRTIDPVYLSVFLNSQMGQAQVRKHQRGSSGQIELYPRVIARFEVWQAPESIPEGNSTTGC